MKISLFIPTYNAMTSCPDIFIQSLSSIKHACLNQVLIIDSSSTDNTAAIARDYGFECIVIPKSEFDHGGTRQMAFKYLQPDNDFIIYLTQDALIPDALILDKLIQPLLNNPEIAGSYGRQVPHTDADIFARHLRMFNYQRGTYVRGYEDRFVWGMDCIFASDSFSAYNIKALREVGGFPKHVIFGEDVYVFAKLVEAGYKVAYVADAICQHSHNYKIGDDFKRYFDIGVFHRSEEWILRDFGHVSKRGIKYALSQWQYVIRHKPWLLPKSIIKICAKFIGYKFGYNYDRISVYLCRKFSMNSQFWQ